VGLTSRGLASVSLSGTAFDALTEPVELVHAARTMMKIREKR
jgi:hypothetical protein